MRWLTIVFCLALICGILWLASVWLFPKFRPQSLSVNSTRFEVLFRDGVKFSIQAWYPDDKNATGGVLLYASAWGGNCRENATLCEALAAEGFTVLSIDRPPGPPLPPLDFSTDASLQLFHLAAEKELNTQTIELLQLFAALPTIKQFNHRLDSASVGVFGYSFGGAVAAEACRREPRLRAGANLDGTLFGEAAKVGASQPFLFVTDFEPVPSDADLHSPDGATRRSAEFSSTGLRDMNRWLQTRGGWLVQFEGVQHVNFCDAALESRWRRTSGTGPRNAEKTLADIRACVAAFFQQTLGGRKSALLDHNFSPWPGVEIKRFPPPKAD